MSIPVLVQVYDEARRLAIAGSVVAPGDFRLKKLIAPLQQSGEKAPVFAKIAAAAQAVVESDEKTAAVALLELATLVTAVLYTQGATGVTGDLEPIESIDLGVGVTQANARLIKPLLDALSTTGSGRLEVVKDAFEQGAFKDLRLVMPALKALDDPYPDIADFVARNVLPTYGQAIVPQLRAGLDVTGRGSDAHRLRLLHALDPDGSRDLVQKALDDGSKELRVVAIECLEPSGDAVAELLKQAKAKATEVRTAALRALSRATDTRKELLATLTKAVAGNDLALFGGVAGRFALPEVRAFVLEQAKQELTDLYGAKDKEQQGKAVTRLQLLIPLAAKQDEPASEVFVLECFDQAKQLAAIKSTPSGADLNELVAHVMARGSTALRQRLADEARTISGDAFQPAVVAARSTQSPAAFYDAFAPLLSAAMAKRTKSNATEHDRGRLLVNVLAGEADRLPYVYRRWIRGHLYGPDDLKLPELDPRWLDAALAADAEQLIYRLARPDHAGVATYLTTQLGKAKDVYASYHVIGVMARVRHPGAADALIAAITKQAKGTAPYYDYFAGRLVREMPKADAGKFDALLPTLPDKIANRLADDVQALKEKPE